MNFLKLLQTHSNKYPPRINVILFCIFMFSINSFVIWFAVATYNRGSENLQDLTHVTGELKGYRIMQHEQASKYKTYYKDVIVIRIDSCDDEFGFMEYNEFYAQLANVVNRKEPPLFEIYYDKNRQRIEENVTLHIFDMTINGEKYLSIEDIKKTEYRGTLICSAIALILLGITYWGCKKIIQRGDRSGFKDKRNRQNKKTNT